MRDAIGGVFTLQIVLVLVVLLNGYMAYSVNYTRAFRVKNSIINIIEEQEGFSEGSKAAEEISSLVKTAGYGLSSTQKQAVISNNHKDGWYCSGNDGYCVKCIDNSGDNTINADDASYRGVYYTVKTYVNMDIPILNRVFSGLPDFLAVRGDTKTVYAKNGCSNMNR